MGDYYRGPGMGPGMGMGYSGGGYDGGFGDDRSRKGFGNQSILNVTFWVSVVQPCMFSAGGGGYDGGYGVGGGGGGYGGGGHGGGFGDRVGVISQYS
jgi:ATP-dependent RNA helicase DDX5/DBP2